MDEEQDSYIEDIADDVLAVLKRDGFFARLEPLVWPNGPEALRVCQNDYRFSEASLDDRHSPEDREDIFDVFRARGGFCDCEVMLNVAEECQVRELYWKNEANELRKKTVAD